VRDWPSPEEYAAAKPFPHAVLDTFLDRTFAATLADEFPPLSDSRWTLHDDPTERKWQGDDPTMWGPGMIGLMRGLRSGSFVRQLCDLTGIEGLFADTLGGGYHLIGEGGFLGIHSDYNRHPEGWYRAVNLLIFLDDLPLDSAGGLELWQPPEHMTFAGERYGAMYLPQRGRAVIFTTSATSFHGHPRPLRAPVRRSIAVYFFTPDPPPAYDGDQPTTFLDEHGNRVVVGQ
jgi:hypothetical protein